MILGSFFGGFKTFSFKDGRSGNIHTVGSSIARYSSTIGSVCWLKVEYDLCGTIIIGSVTVSVPWTSFLKYCCISSRSVWMLASKMAGSNLPSVTCS